MLLAERIVRLPSLRVKSIILGIAFPKWETEVNAQIAEDASDNRIKDIIFENKYKI